MDKNQTLPFLIQIDGVFTSGQCQKLIDLAESKKMEYIDRANAQYYRVILDSKELADSLYKQLKYLIPETRNKKRVVGLNNVFRFSKYLKGDEFGMHKDGYNQDYQGNRSAMTLNIFLNEDFEGGETNFYYTADENDLRFSVKPKIGRGALFDSQQYHKGNAVLSGIKYLIRTDVMVSDN